MGIAWNSTEHSDSENLQWCWLRASEWGCWPVFLSIPIVPIFLIFTKWWIVIGSVAILSILWSPIRDIIGNNISIAAVSIGAYLVVLKWITCPLAAFILILHHKYILAIIALLWPVIAGFFQIFCGRVQIGIYQNILMARIGCDYSEPFNKKHDLPWIKRDSAENVNLEFTVDEQHEIQKSFNYFLSDGQLYTPKECVDEVQKAIAARGLSNYAEDQASNASFVSDNKKQEEHMNKAIAAIWKAYSLFPLPIYIYDAACFIGMSCKYDAAVAAMKDFLKLQETFKPNQVHELFLSQRDINSAINDAKEKIRLYNR